MTLLVMIFGIFEWRVRTGRLLNPGAAYVFPVSNMLGGVMMLTHSHVLENIQEALLIELSHIPIGVLALVAGSARWLELRADSPVRERAGWVWPLAFVGVGLVLLFYRES
jgi:putative copper resistance protein D